MEPACPTRWTSPHLTLNAQSLLLSRQYTRLFHSFAKSSVHPNLGVIISPPGETGGLVSVSAALERKA